MFERKQDECKMYNHKRVLSWLDHPPECLSFCSYGIFVFMWGRMCFTLSMVLYINLPKVSRYNENVISKIIGYLPVDELGVIG